MTKKTWYEEMDWSMDHEPWLFDDTIPNPKGDRMQGPGFYVWSIWLRFWWALKEKLHRA